MAFLPAKRSTQVNLERGGAKAWATCLYVSNNASPHQSKTPAKLN